MAVENISIRIKDNIKDIEKELDSLDRRIAKLKGQRPAIEWNTTKLKKAKEEIKNINVDIKKLQAQKATIKADVNTKDAKEKISALNQQIKQLQSRKANLQIVTTQLQGSEAQLRKLDNEISRLNNRKAMLQIDSRGLGETGEESRKLQNSLRNMSERTYKINVSSNLDKLSGLANNASNKILGSFNPLTSKLNQMLGIGLAVKAVDKATSMITNSIDGSISRLDTLNNFEKVMSNMNISADQADIAKSKLVKGLNGLPTTLDDAVASVQRFTANNKDVQKSADIFLALNNAILAGGMSREIQSSALEQISQSYSKGKPDMIEWRSLLTAMPAQVDQIGKSFGLTSDQLGEALRNGNISMDQFMDRIVEMNKNGAEGFKSFEEQARNSVGGVRTGMSIMNSAITRGVTSIIDTFDKMAKDKGLGGIAGIFGKIGAAFEDNLKKIGAFAEEHSDDIFLFFDKGMQFLSKIDYASFFKGLGEGLKELKNDAKKMFDYFKPLLDKLGDGNTMEGIGKLIPRLFELGLALKAVSIGAKGLSVVSKVFGVFSKLKIPKFGKGGGASEIVKPLESLKSIGTGFLKNAGNLALLFGAIKVLEEGAEAMKQLDEKIPNDFTGLAKKTASMSLAISAIGGLAFIASKLNFTDNLKGIASIALISVDLMIASEAMNQLNEKVPNNIGIVAKKLGSLSIAIGAMAGLVVIAGTFSSANPTMAISGLASVALLSLELMIASEALSQLNEKVPSDIATIAKKVANIGIAIGAMGLLVGVIGGLSIATFPAAIAGLAAVSLLAGELMLVSESINQLNKKVPEDITSVKNKLESLEEVLSYMAKSSIGKLSSLFKGIIGTFTASTYVQVIDGLIEVSNGLKRLSSASEDINSAKLINNIYDINKAVEVIGGKDNIFEKLGSLMKGKVDTAIFDEMENILNKMISLSNKMKTLQENKFSISDITSKVTVIKDILEKLDPADWDIAKYGVVSSKIIDQADTTIFWLNKLSKKLTALSESKLEKGMVQSVIENIKGALTMLTNERWGAFDSGIVPIELIETIGKSVDGLNSINKKLSKLSETSFDVLKTQTMISGIKSSLRMLQIKSWGDFEEGIIDRTTLDKLDTAVYWLTNIAKKFETFANFKFENGKLQETIANIKGALRLLQIKSWGDFNEGIVDKRLLDQLDTGVYWLGKVGSKLSELSSLPLERGKAQDVIGNIKGALRMLIVSSWDDFKEGFIGKDMLDSIDTSVYWLTNVGNRLTGLANINLDVTKAEAVIRDTKGALRMFQADKWTDFNKGVVKADFIKALDMIVENFITLSNRTNGLSGIVEDITKVHDTITAVKGVINRMTTDTFPDPSLMVSEKFIDQIDTSVYRLITLANRINQIPKLNADVDTLGTNIRSIKYVAEEMAINKWKGISEGVVSSDTLGIIASAVSKLGTISNKLSPLNVLPFDWTSVLSNVNRMKSIIELMNTFPSAKGLDSIPELVESFKNLLITLQGLESKFEPIGKSYGQQVINGFKNADVPSKIKKVIDDLITNLRNKDTEFNNVGKGFGDSLKSGFTNALQGLDSNIDSYVTSINNKISSIQTNLNSLTAPSLTVDVTENVKTRRVTRANGGIIPQYRANGGSIMKHIFKPKGTDRVPAMLTAGEYVQRKKAVDHFGIDFMERINNLDLSGALASITNRFGNSQPVSNVMNRYYNTTKNTRNNNNTINQNISMTGNPNFANLRANRFLRGV
ncbi:TPA: tape measure protein [Enterococcus faecalis]|uniref:tape measure protein n=1 Tax=Enterococcus faecalis TaxID=1351 RepID=UPI00032E1398|nr:tape measure protein [Enterococcus faecalis]HDC0030460.1 tape measure protein [Escherichia coli]AXG88839.1 phage tail protein [Enterococcus faecalis]EOK53970.1 tape measure domain-containing protein [Enterococcus faecalis EnGen0061]MCU2202633.1 tape measure protein [Enterococcus faecalis]STP94891.1 tail protein [Enterococcus faecalis]